MAKKFKVLTKTLQIHTVVTICDNDDDDGTTVHFLLEDAAQQYKAKILLVVLEEALKAGMVSIDNGQT